MEPSPDFRLLLLMIWTLPSTQGSRQALPGLWELKQWRAKAAGHPPEARSLDAQCTMGWTSL